jgi:hypothetical protein
MLRTVATAPVSKPHTIARRAPRRKTAAAATAAHPAAIFQRRLRLI